ncbi:MAG: nicotinamide-nucleotide adenylyltransferase [Candidatus Aenigmatarchaeota archaeon]|nr:MAG: nicotinamide-nucleotide adenylyltransferase [Candidatus Aenigmarchaeota archaeon]
MAKALLVGRFQPFHKGHLKVVESLAKRYDILYIVIGSANESGTVKNPFTVEERIEMIKRSLEPRGITNFELHSIQDFHDDKMWTTLIKKSVDFDVVYSRNSWTLDCFRKEGTKARKHKFYQQRKYSGHEIRRRILHGISWRDLVPLEVYDYLRSIKGEERIKKL